MSRDDRIELIRRLLELLGVAVAIWVTLPEHERQQLMMTLAHHSRTGLEATARRCGRWAITLELQGRGETIGYRWAYDLMTGPVHRAERLYDKIRGAV